MRKHIFIVNGKARAGKDTFADILKKFTTVYKYSSIDRIKKIAVTCGWKGGKTEIDRKFLSDLKSITTEYSDLAFNDIKLRVRSFLKDKCLNEVMLIDIREPEEIERCKIALGAKTIFIKNDRVENINTNSSDANVENYKYDFTIENNGDLAMFEEQIKLFYNEEITN